MKLLEVLLDTLQQSPYYYYFFSRKIGRFEIWCISIGVYVFTGVNIVVSKENGGYKTVFTP